MQRLGAFFTRIAQRHLPDPFVLACVLTLVVGLVALVIPYDAALRAAPPAARAAQVTRVWLTGLWNPAFLTFALQMCLVLLTGFGLAKAPPALRALRRLAGWPASNRGAVALIAAVSCTGCWINWGFGLIVAGVLAAEVRAALARRAIGCQYPLVVAAAYVGMMIWHGGLSGSAPLKVAEVGIAIPARDGGAPGEIPPISMAATTLSGANLLLSAALLIGIPVTLRTLAARRVDWTPDDVASPFSPPAQDVAAPAAGWADRLNRSRALALAVGVLLLVGVGVQTVDALGRGSASALVAGLGALNLNTLNSVFLALGLLLHPHIGSYVSAITEGGRAIAGIVIQFPLYSGIQALMFGAGLAAGLSEMFVEVSQWAADVLGVSATATFPVATFASAGLVNFFVPSGGGQWIVQGPIMCEAASTLGASVPQTVMAIAYGDQLTNMVQPFWAIPLMGLTRVDARAFMGYCALIMLLAAPVMALGLLLF